MIVLATTVALAFAGLAAIHVYWALGGRHGAVAAIPEAKGKPLLQPGTAGTLVVAVLLTLAAAMVLQRAGVGPRFAPLLINRCGTWGVAVALMLRAIGDFNYVGLFKRRRGTRFARLDTLFCTPLTLALGVATVVIATYG